MTAPLHNEDDDHIWQEACVVIAGILPSEDDETADDEERRTDLASDIGRALHRAELLRAAVTAEPKCEHGAVLSGLCAAVETWVNGLVEPTNEEVEAAASALRRQWLAGGGTIHETARAVLTAAREVRS